ncbi:GntR family transcriptional regulator [Kineococcus sp. GCM10028916]|uniref:GntR family transcriptional regulator n=1 Tax=Kineococcus sp. GCM10028916 TaxID=3273394 RepID=UPI00362FF544
MSPPPARTSRLAQRAGSPRGARALVLDELRRRIVGLEYPPGTPLSENELAAALGVSRTPVRESLILLVEDGLVNVVPQVGTFVSPLRESEIATAQFVREALELASLEQAVPQVGEDDVEDLRRSLADQRRAAARGEHDRFFALDEEFHLRLLAVSGHAAAWRSVSRAKVHLDRARRLSLPLPDQLDVLIDQHEAVVDAVAAHDADTAATALRSHLRKVFDDIAVVRAEHPEFFSDDR